jgi:predicted RNase H-like HicB family nuclease
MREYIGIIHQDPKSDFGVSFPDFPGVVTAGKSLDDACAMAEEALTFHIDGIIADGGPIPEPSGLEAIIADASYTSAVAVLVVDWEEAAS